MPSLQLEDIAQAILKRPWVVLLVVLGFVGPTLGFTLFKTPVYEAPVYEASATLVAAKPAAGQKPEQKASGIQLIHPVVVGIERREASLLRSRPVVEETIQRLGLRTEPGELLENLTVERVGSIAYIKLSYRDTDPQRARQIAYTVGEVSSERISTDDMTVEVAGGPVLVEHTNPVSPELVRKAIVALGLGLMLGIGLALLMEQRAT